MKHKNGFSGFLAVALLLALSSCDLTSMIWSDEDSGGDGGGGHSGGTVTMATYLADFESALHWQSVRFLSDAEVSVIVQAGRQEIGAATNSSDLTTHVPIAVEGAESALAGSLFVAYDDEAKGAVLRAIVASAASALSGKGHLLLSSAQSLSPYTDALLHILERISEAAVRGVSRAGFAADRVSEMAGEAVGSLVENAASAGVRRENISASSERITRAAVEAAAALTGSDTTARRMVITHITEAGMSGAAKAAERLQAYDDLDQIVENVTLGAARGIKTVAADEDEAVALIEAIGDGFAQGVNRMVDEGAAIDGENLNELVTGAARGATRAIKDIGQIASQHTTAALITKTSESMSRAASQIRIEEITGAVRGTVLGRVAQGTAEGAQELQSGGIDKETLLGCVKIVEVDETGSEITHETVEFLQQIETGLDRGLNTPPIADAGPDQVTTVGETVTLDGSLSSDEEDGQPIAFQWSITASPSVSSAVLLDAQTESSSLTPDVAGTFTVTLLVTDGAGATATNSCDILVNPAAGDVTYGGKTAEQRLAEAEWHVDHRRPRTARDECLTIINRYPVTETTPRAKLLLGQVYRHINEPWKALAAFSSVITDHAASPEAPDAMNARGWIYLRNLPEDDQDWARARTLFQNVKDQYPGTSQAKDADLGIAYYHILDGDSSTARGIQDSIRNDTSLPFMTRYWAQYNYAESYLLEGNTSQAVTEFTKLTQPEFYLDGGDVQRWALNRTGRRIAGVYRWEIGDYASADAAYRWLMAQVQVGTTPRAFAQIELAQMKGWDENDYAEAVELSRSVPSLYPAADDGDADIREAHAWSHFFVGEFSMQRYWNDNSLTISERNDLIDRAKTAYNTVISTFSDVDLGEAAARARVGLSVIYREEDDFSRAIALCNQVITSYSSDADPSPLPQAYYELGRAYERRGDAKRDLVNQDPMPDYRAAISYFRRVNEAEFPRWRIYSDWVLDRAPRRIGEVYSDMGDHELSRGYLYSLVRQEDVYDEEDRADILQLIVRTYRTQIDDYLDSDRCQEAITLRSEARAAIDDLRSLTFADPGNPVDGARSFANALARAVRIYLDLAECYEELGGDPSSALGEVRAFADEFIDDYADWDYQDWELVDVYNAKAEYYQRTGNFGDGVATLEELIDLVPLGSEASLRAHNELGDLYREEADWDEPDWQNHLLAAAGHYQSVLSAVLTDPANWPEDEGVVGDSAVELAHCYADLAAGDPTSPHFNNAVLAYGNVTGSGPYAIADNREYEAEGLRGFGDLYRDAGNFHMGSDNPDLAVAIANYQNAISRYENALDHPALRDHDEPRVLERLVSCLVDLYRAQAWHGSTPDSDLLAEAYDHMFAIIAHPRADSERQAWARVDAYEIAEAVIEEGELDDLYDVMGYAVGTDLVVLFNEILFLLQEVVDHYADVDGGEPASEAQLRLGRWNQHFGDYHNGGGDPDGAEPYYNAAVAGYDAVIAMSGKWQDWIIEWAEYLKAEVEAVLAAL
jgi:tetratricopeptide (TPR) repeat protein